jgi:8-oxo-dGTP diphosphatase
MPAVASVIVYLILEKDNKLLLGLRENTGYMDGFYCLVAGSVEENESAKQALAREALEEAGLIINPEDLSIAHIMHRKSGKNTIDIFMSCQSYEGEITNMEPHKCKELMYHSPEMVSNDIVPYVKIALENVRKNVFYSEVDWVA